MGDNKDRRKKLAGHIRSYNEHVLKRDRYQKDYEKAGAARTMAQEIQHMKKLCLDLGRQLPKVCRACDRIHEDGSACR